MDNYIRDFKPDDQFLDIGHFMFLCASADKKLKQMDYDKEKMLRVRMRLANVQIQMPSSSYESEIADVVGDRVKLKHKVMFFSGDEFNIGVISVSPVGQCKDFKRATLASKWIAKKDGDNVYWYSDSEGVGLINKGICNPKKVEVVYIPEIATDCEDANIQGSREYDILTMCMNFLKGTDAGTVIDMYNNGNNNKILQFEVDKNQMKD